MLVDQLASVDPLEGFARDRLERLRDPSHQRTLSDQDVRGLLEANWLVLRRSQVDREELDVGRFLELAACEGEPAARSSTRWSGSWDAASGPGSPSAARTAATR